MAGLLNKIVKRTMENLEFSGKRVNDIALGKFLNEVIIDSSYQPVFFLSTGRAGTLLFTNILNSFKGVRTYHAPTPELIGQSKFAYDKYFTVNDINDDEINIFLGQLFLAAREDYLYKTYMHGYRYIETNNRITFFAPAIKKIIPGAKFVYVYRHPGEFIRSGIRRNWYSGGHTHDHGRIKPLENSEHFNKWNDYSPVEKIAWLWNETNGFIEKFLGTIPDSDYIKLNFNMISAESVEDILKFTGLQMSRDKIETYLGKKVNVQKKGSYPKYEEWSRDDKEKVNNICGQLASEYGYKLIP